MALESPIRRINASHLHELVHGSGISEAVLEREQVYSASREEVARLLGWDAGSSGIVFPYHDTGDFFRVRLDEPYRGPGYSKPAKYLSPRGSGNRLYIPRSVPTEVLLGCEQLIITEGEKKALAACSRSIWCIATSGIWSWKERNAYGERQGDDAILPDFGRVNWQGRELVVLLYDSDITQEHVAWPAYGRLAEQLYRLGAVAVKVVTLPHVAPGDKTGLDDYLLRRSPSDLWELIHRAPVWVPSGDGAQAFVERRIDAACRRMETERTPEAAYDTETLLALVSASMWADTEYARYRSRLTQRGLGIEKRALDRRVKELRAKVEERQGTKRPAPPPPTGGVEELLPDAPIKLRRPAGWHVSERGVYGYVKEESILACACPVLITKRLRRVDIGEERVELAFFRDGGWRTVRAQPSTVFASRTVVQLADRGLPVTSETARHFVRFLGDLQKENDDIIPRVRAVGHYGWIGSGAFLPGAAEDVEVDIEGGPIGYGPSGSEEEWLRLAAYARRHPAVRFLLSCSFAAPLLRLLDHRTFIVHLWGPSRGGKTAAGWLAVSAWGDPDSLRGSFYATRVGLERMAALYSDLPLLVDERQVAGDRQGMIEGIVYLLGLGQSKVRGSKSGGLQATQFWNTVVLTTGEEPITTDASATGVRTRTLEWYVQPFEDDEEEARSVYSVTRRHHGHAGPAFIRHLLALLQEDPEALKRDYEVTTKHLQKVAGDVLGSHVTAVAVVAVADYYSSQWVFGEPEEDAYRGALGLAEHVLSQLDRASDSDQAIQAMEFIRSWVEQHRPKFEKDAGTNERFGWFGDDFGADRGYVYIYPTAFKRAMKEGGFSERRVLQDFAQRGWIDTVMSNGKMRYKILKRFAGEVVRVLALRPERGAEEP